MNGHPAEGLSLFFNRPEVTLNIGDIKLDWYRATQTKVCPCRALLLSYDMVHEDMIYDPYSMYYGNIIYKNIYLYGLSLKLNGRGASSVSVTSGGLSWNETERVRIYNIRLKIHSKNEPVTSSDVSWSKHVTQVSDHPSIYSNGFDPSK